MVTEPSWGAVPWLEFLLGRALRLVISERPHPLAWWWGEPTSAGECRHGFGYLHNRDVHTHQERESSRGRLGAALLRKGEMASQGFTRHNKLGKAYLAREGTKAPVDVFYILCVEHAHFLICVFILF